MADNQVAYQNAKSQVNGLWHSKCSDHPSDHVCAICNDDWVKWKKETNLTLDDIYAHAFQKADFNYMPLKSISFSGEGVTTFNFQYPDDQKEIAIVTKDVSRQRINEFFERVKATC